MDPLKINHSIILLELYLNESWSYIILSENPNITWEYIQGHPDKPWNYIYLSKNPNITWEIVAANPNKNWEYTYLSSNEFNKNPIIRKKVISTEILQALERKCKIY